MRFFAVLFLGFFAIISTMLFIVLPFISDVKWSAEIKVLSLFFFIVSSVAIVMIAAKKGMDKDFGG